MGNQTNFSNTNPGTPNPANQQVGQQPGVTGTQGTPQGVNPPAGSGDGQTTLEDALAQIQQRELDINRLKSTYDKKFSESDKQYKQRLTDLENKMHQAVTAKMDEAEKVKYDLQFTQQKLQQLQAERDQLEQEKLSWQSIITIRDQMIQAGIPADKLDLSSQEALSTSAWTYLIQDREEKRRQLEALQQPQQQQQTFRPQQQQYQPQRQPVITNPTGQPTPTQMTLDTIRQSLEASLGRHVSDDEFFKMAERGKIDLTQIK